MSLGQKVSNLLANALDSFDTRVQIGIFCHRATSGVEFGSNYNAKGVKRLASKIMRIAKDAELSAYRATTRLRCGGDSGGSSPVHLPSQGARCAAALVLGLSPTQL
jgi:hypothetical protein